MGYDLNRFDGNVDEELICPICSYILEDPVQSPECEHAFCNMCINQWLRHQSTCPIDRTPIQSNQLKPVPRILKNLLSKLKLKCDYASYGCTTIVRLENLSSHLHECEFNPKKPTVCTLGCNIVLMKDELKNHSCVRELRKTIDDQQIKIDQLSGEVTRQKTDLENYIHELRILKSFAAKCFKIINNNSLNLSIDSSFSLSGFSIGENDEFLRWSSTLTLAKVNRWGGIKINKYLNKFFFIFNLFWK